MRVEHDKFGGATMRSILETKSIRRGTQSVLMFHECGSTSATRQMVLFALRFVRLRLAIAGAVICVVLIVLGVYAGDNLPSRL